MVTASRTPDQYDGYVAIAPGFNLPKAAVQHAWDVQSFRTVNPDIRQSFSATDMALVAQGVLGACDRLDGLADGLVNSKGEALCSDWSFDGGMGAKNWRGWKVEGIPAWDGYLVIAVMGAASLSHVFTTPPTPVAGRRPPPVSSPCQG